MSNGGWSSRIMILWLASVGVVAAASQPTPPARTPVDLSTRGPRVGDRVPDFNLNDQNGRSWTLQSIMGPKGAMLVFYRSADW
jgi:hypothetical protein